MRARALLSTVAIALPLALVVGIQVSDAGWLAPPAAPSPPPPDEPRAPTWLLDAAVPPDLAFTADPPDAAPVLGDHPLYARLREARDRYAAVAEAGGFPDVPDLGPVGLGDVDPQVPALRQRLRDEGDLQADAQGVEAMTFDADVERALKHLQRRYGLHADGRLGAPTRKALAVPIGERLGEIEQSLASAWRLGPGTAPREVVVNVAAFELHGLEQGRSTIEMPVIVGEHPGHETPTFSDEIETVVFRPVWNVPISISGREMNASALSNPAYLARRGFEIVDARGRHLGPGAVSDGALRSGRIRVRQRPGSANALGLVKFVFPNAYGVYLHDTPNDSLFGRAIRDLSHGCVRVARPVELAAWLLRDKGWDEAKADAAMHAGGSRWVRLEPHVPVHLVYLTAWPDEDGGVRFLHDVYGRATGP